MSQESSVVPAKGQSGKVPRVMRVTAEIFERMTEALRRDVWMVQAHLQLYWRLQEAVKFHPDAIKEAPHFWTSYARANLETAVFVLCRIYDQLPTSFNIGCWLEAVRDSKKTIIESANLETIADFSDEDEDDEGFVRETNPDPASHLFYIEPSTELPGIDADLLLVGEDDPLVKKLRLRRHNVIMHKSLTYLIKGTDGPKKHAMTHEEVKTLCKRAFDLLNKYSLTLKMQEMFEFVGAEDFHIVIEALDASKEFRRQRLLATDPVRIVEAMQEMKKPPVS